MLIRNIKKYKPNPTHWKTHSITQPPCIFVHSSPNPFSPLQIMSPELLRNLLDNAKYIVLHKVIYLHLWKISNESYFGIQNFSNVVFEFKHQPCWVIRILYDIPNIDFLRNLIYFLTRLGYTWLVIIQAPISPLLTHLIELFESSTLNL